MEAIGGQLMGDDDPNKDHAQIIKRKRTKRQRPQSPIPLISIPFASLSSSGEGAGGGYEDNNIASAATATSSTSGESVMTDEEEDVANCLILLSQGPPRADEKNVSKFKSKRFLQISPMGGGGKAGTYVYQCKTCDRTFPSFQALGGHRASHSRPKSNADTEYDNEHEEQMKKQYVNAGPLGGGNNPNASSKVHECSFCGAEFSSGQALGGHMRRHRASVGTNTSFSTSPRTARYEFVDPKDKKARIALSLDLDLGLNLNLPAPEDDRLLGSKDEFTSKQKEHQSQHQQQQHSPIGSQQQQHSSIGFDPLLVSKEGFTSKQQEQQSPIGSQQRQHQQKSPIGTQQQQQQQVPIGLSVAPALVDCHY